jgi:hypothetical protein
MHSLSARYDGAFLSLVFLSTKNISPVIMFMKTEYVPIGQAHIYIEIAGCGQIISGD